MLQTNLKPPVDETCVGLILLFRFGGRAGRKAEGYAVRGVLYVAEPKGKGRIFRQTSLVGGRVWGVNILTNAKGVNWCKTSQKYNTCGGLLDSI